MRRDVDPRDVQALALTAFGWLTAASYLLLRVADAASARAFLHGLTPTTIADLSQLQQATQVAFTAAGLHALGLAKEVVGGFAPEFAQGLANNANRALRLGDIGVNAPQHWEWGYGEREPHVLIALFSTPEAHDGQLESVRRNAAASGLVEVAVEPTADLQGREPFGFVDGVSQPSFDWDAPRDPGGPADRAYTNLIALGELLLGYRNEYREIAASPVVPGGTPGAEALAPATHPAGTRDLGRNGSYLVYRRLDQDVTGFWRWVNQEAERTGVTPRALAEAMVGRGLDGGPPADVESGRDIPGVDPRARGRNGYFYDVDPDGLACPIGSHVRRANPRTGDMPAAVDGPFDALSTALGFTRRRQARPTSSTLPWPRNTTVWPFQRTRDDALSSARFHRILRRGREFREPRDGAAPRTGLQFLCLNANLSRQFEFVQGAWLANAKFAGLNGEQDPLLGNRAPFPDRPVVAEPVATDAFSRPGAAPNCRYSSGLPTFVTVRGGAYFFLPGIAAYRWLTKP